jgi:hypothetical protein
MDRNERSCTGHERPIQREGSTRAQASAESKKRHRAKKRRSRLRQTSPRRQTRVEMACGSHFVRPPRAILNTLIQLDFSSLLLALFFLPDSVAFFVRRLMTSFQVSNDRWNPPSFGLRHSSPERAPPMFGYCRVLPPTRSVFQVARSRDC